ncbi:MAG: two-component system sensor histidine kinase RegB [Oleiphilaceae bacterium]|jgi:two-component system sensor histidine kinase RegB
MFLKHTLMLSSSHKNLTLIAAARVVLWCVAELLIVVNQLWLHLPFNELLVHCVLAAFALTAIAAFIQARSARHISDNSMLRHLTIDVLMMTWVFHLVGGAANPFVSILLFPLTISAAILPSRFTWFMVVLSLASYGSLFLPTDGATDLVVDHSQHSHSHGSQQSVFSLHLVGMWFNFAISAILISFFVVKMRQQIQQQQQKINTQREKALRDEQLLGIATQAASAAHHISTPLSTMAVIINDLRLTQTSEPLQEDLKLISAQIDNCSDVLNALRHRDKPNEPISLSLFINQLIDEFILMQPEAVLEKHIDDLAMFHISSDPSLRMALLNVLNNAADASPQKMQLNVTLKKETIQIKIRDFGVGFPEYFSNNTAISGTETPIISSKPNGMGIGLFLSHATINQYQGKISLTNMTPGTLVYITLPLLFSTPTAPQPATQKS